ncbi:unnamed protein product [Staurois parvus]|uniref:Uncharacterized protein n=1 Tax=Staurois parvus TaxID=386267 RepID=A0ABN9BUE6_9NEOB|nr:unnamed protein product [Staurois parvus]
MQGGPATCSSAHKKTPIHKTNDHRHTSILITAIPQTNTLFTAIHHTSTLITAIPHTSILITSIPQTSILITRYSIPAS